MRAVSPITAAELYLTVPCWGVLEQHWNATLLDALDTVVCFARTMTWKGHHPVVELVTTTYKRGLTLTREAMADVEAHLHMASR